MIADEFSTDSKHITIENSTDDPDKKGQMLVIYLPEGSVIVDRSDINLSTAPTEILQQIEKKSEAKIAAPVVEPAPVKYSITSMEEVVQLTVTEVLRVLRESSKSLQKEETPVTSLPSEYAMAPTVVEEEKLEEVPIVAVVEPVVAAPTFNERVTSAARNSDFLGQANNYSASNILTNSASLQPYYPSRNVSMIRRRRPNRVQFYNNILIAYLLIVTILPTLLLSGLGISIYAAEASYPTVSIARGDLMIAKPVVASQLKAKDVVLTRIGTSWTADALQVASQVTIGGSSTIEFSSVRGAPLTETVVWDQNRSTFEVSRVIPTLGYVSLFFSSIYVKVLGALLILVLNIRARRGRSLRRSGIDRSYGRNNRNSRNRRDDRYRRDDRNYQNGRDDLNRGSDDYFR